MLVFLVARYGNNEEGSNGADTLFLVRADNHLAAAHIAECALSQQPAILVKPICNWICELGVDSTGRQAGEIIKGPFYDLSGARGCVRVWTRDYADDPWTLITDSFDETQQAHETENIDKGRS